MIKINKKVVKITKTVVMVAVLTVGSFGFLNSLSSEESLEEVKMIEAQWEEARRLWAEAEINSMKAEGKITVKEMEGKTVVIVPEELYNETKNLTEEAGMYVSKKHSVDTHKVVENEYLDKSLDFKGLSYVDNVDYNSEAGEMLRESDTRIDGIQSLEDAICISIDKTLGFERGARIIVTTTDVEFKAVVVDFKEHDGAMLNFICDKDKIPGTVKTMGSFNVLDDFSGEIIRIEEE